MGVCNVCGHLGDAVWDRLGRLAHISMRMQDSGPAAMWRVAECGSLNNAVERNDPVSQTK